MERARLDKDLAYSPERKAAIFAKMLPPYNMENVRRQSRSPRHIQTPNPSKGPIGGLFSFCFKGRWQGHPPFGDWALDAEWVSEWPASLFERPSTVTGRRKTSSHFQWVAAFMGSSLSRDNPVAETDAKAQGGQRDGSVAADPKSGGSVRSEPRPCQKSLMTNRLRAHSLAQCRTARGQMKRTT